MIFTFTTVMLAKTVNIRRKCRADLHSANWIDEEYNNIINSSRIQAALFVRRQNREKT